MIDNILKTRFTARSFADIPVDADHLTQAIEVLKIANKFNWQKLIRDNNSEEWKDK